ncbi:MAG: bifunctional riboflavin kinase/FAD synthetase [Sulfurospirillaceae bacterium]|nr:bifunctional riboflavin kinase/FAD synthetase [Sulfurospirillaceae bacterium]
MQKRSTILRKDSVDTIALGSFDGIHIGHKQLIRKLGERGALFVVDKDQANLTPGIKRSEYAGYPCMFYHFTKVKELSGAEFIALLKKEFIHLKKILVGYDFHFGKYRSCNAHDLKTLFDGDVEIVEEFCYKGIAVHSSNIRAFLQEGKIDEANRFLGREYALLGDVIAGQGIGQKELVPTLNLKVLDYLIPKEGVYASRSKINHKIYDSVTFIGKRLSTDGDFSIETHIIDEEIVDVESSVEIYFVEYIRANQKFSNLQELKVQIEHDILRAKEVLVTCKLYLVDFL